MNLTITGKNFHAVKYPKIYIASGNIIPNKTNYEVCKLLEDETYLTVIQNTENKLAKEFVSS